MADINSEDEELSYTKAKRKQLIESLSKNGAPNDVKDQSIMLQALDGLDRITLTRMRLRSEEGISTSQVAAAAILAQLFNNPQTKKVGRSGDAVAAIPTLRTDLPAIDVVAGELDAVPVKDNYDAFMKRNGVEEII